MTPLPSAIRALCAMAFVGLSGCGDIQDPDGAPRVAVPDFASAQIKPPPAPPRTRVLGPRRGPQHSQTRSSPPVIEVAPAQINEDGTVRSPARYRTETAQAITRERQELVFETPCPHALTPEVIATLQQALERAGCIAGRSRGSWMSALCWRCVATRTPVTCQARCCRCNRRVGLAFWQRRWINFDPATRTPDRFASHCLQFCKTALAKKKLCIMGLSLQKFAIQKRQICKVFAALCRAFDPEACRNVVCAVGQDRQGTGGDRDGL